MHKLVYTKIDKNTGEEIFREVKRFYSIYNAEGYRNRILDSHVECPRHIEEKVTITTNH